MSVLGGHLPNTGQGDGVTVLTFSTDIQNNGDTASIRPQLYWYRTSGVVQDFTIFPTTDKGAGTFGTIFMIVEEPRGTTVQAFQYPPILADASTVDEANDKAINMEFSAEFEESAEISRTLDSTLQ
ncbi:MAG TPA: hypothetical protein VGO47_11065, partial [Chlamydiales bacterium]|nr:hypothetical protein [Chlamydiales bacterium]